MTNRKELGSYNFHSQEDYYDARHQFMEEETFRQQTREDDLRDQMERLNIHTIKEMLLRDFRIFLSAGQLKSLRMGMDLRRLKLTIDRLYPEDDQECLGRIFEADIKKVLGELYGNSVITSASEEFSLAAMICSNEIAKILLK